MLRIRTETEGVTVQSTRWGVKVRHPGRDPWSATSQHRGWGEALVSPSLCPHLPREEGHILPRGGPLAGLLAAAGAPLPRWYRPRRAHGGGGW